MFVSDKHTNPLARCHPKAIKQFSPKETPNLVSDVKLFANIADVPIRFSIWKNRSILYNTPVCFATRYLAQFSDS